jgi:hypothetical protein
VARIRTIKPEFFTSEDIVAMSPLARLLYVALWCEADKEGRLVWKPKTFKMRYLPADDCSIEALCDELTGSGMVKLYGSGYAWIPGFSRHQHVNPRESASDIPAPEGVKDAGPRKVGKNTREAVFERDGQKCVRCGSDDSLQVDHILPQSCGGPHVMENLRTLCRSCNAGRPVAGKALDEDLKKDGHTLKSLRDKFGIDASIPDKHAQVGREGKGKEGDSSEPDGSEPDLATSFAIPLNDGSEWAVMTRALAEWVQSFPAVDVEQELREMRAWALANPTKRKTSRGVAAFVVRWLAKAQDTPGRSSQRGGDDWTRTAA